MQDIHHTANVPRLSDLTMITTTLLMSQDFLTCVTEIDVTISAYLHKTVHVDHRYIYTQLVHDS